MLTHARGAGGEERVGTQTRLGPGYLVANILCPRSTKPGDRTALIVHLPFNFNDSAIEVHQNECSMFIVYQ